MHQHAASFLVEAAPLAVLTDPRVLVLRPAALLFKKFCLQQGVGLIGVELPRLLRHRPIAAAGGTGTVRTIERKKPRIQVIKRAATLRTGSLGVEHR